MWKVVAFDVYVELDKAFVAIYVIGRAKTRELDHPPQNYYEGIRVIPESECS
jgi:hypothetical protein